MISFAGIDNASASSFSVNTGGIFTGAFGSTSGFFTGSGLIKAPGPDVFFYLSCQYSQSFYRFSILFFHFPFIFRTF